ncbi:FAD-dependent oxidoreductase [Dongia soli]|uniref:FAD-dependent oxidoreductase n=1 Tax=Dongia soli TaxID=600628 RepID=A0ABU5EB02_9PROT|nr:FAD-dependent oxidoreductase [Dongia soli]MDY0883543.1 FAD-dependent oxidoreductase [Dongia soli]
MSRQSADPQLVEFYWNGHPLSGRLGEPIAAALRRHGMGVIARSRKLHRPLGHSGSYIAGVLARVDGRPNVRLDLEPVGQGTRVEAQNVWPSARFDLLKAAQLVPAEALYGGFEHAEWTPQGKRGYHLWERLMAHLAGMSPPPLPSLPSAIRPGRRVQYDVVVVGGGPAGRQAANEAAAAGKKVAIVTRGHICGRYAAACGVEQDAIDDRVSVFTGIELFGSYRQGALLVGAPHRHDQGAIAFDAQEIVLATGRRSIPPLVPGSHVPGVMDAQAALVMAHDHGVAPGKAVAVVGSGVQTLIAKRLTSLGVNVVHVGDVAKLTRINGRTNVTSIEIGATVACDAVVHAGPWHRDPNLIFQTQSAGLLQLVSTEAMGNLRVVGAAGEVDEDIAVPADLSDDVLICPCMDVTAGELLMHIDAGETDPEVLKRLTSCGMGPCQGFPCWDSMIAVLASRLGRHPTEFARPSHRAPRRAITVAQAAGLHDLVEPDR